MRTTHAGWCLAAAMCASVAAASAAERSDATVDRLYVLDCGHSTTHDLSANWTPGTNHGVTYEFTNHCYLVRHGERVFLWDTGIADAVAEKPEGVSAAGGLLVLKVTKTLAAQLRTLGVAPDAVTDIALSHFHSDHAGNASLFAHARHYVQRAERDAAFGPDAAKLGFAPALYGSLANNPTTVLEGDFDVFGDGSVVILSTPGHTPGHQSLYVRLPKRGGVILSGDLVHVVENWKPRRVPLRNFDAEATRKSMARIDDALDELPAELWINHDAHQSDSLPLAPEAVE